MEERREWRQIARSMGVPSINALSHAREQLGRELEEASGVAQPPAAAKKRGRPKGSKNVAHNAFQALASSNPANLPSEKPAKRAKGKAAAETPASEQGADVAGPAPAVGLALPGDMYGNMAGGGLFAQRAEDAQQWQQRLLMMQQQQAMAPNINMMAMQQVAPAVFGLC